MESSIYVERKYLVETAEIVGKDGSDDCLENRVALFREFKSAQILHEVGGIRVGTMRGHHIVGTPMLVVSEGEGWVNRYHE